MSAPLVTGRAVSHRFPGTPPLFSPLDFDLHPGEVTGLCGPSGCGKSTLLSIVAGWLAPTDGVVERLGVHKIGWVFQNPHGVPRRSALDHVVFPLLAAGLTRPRAEDEALAIMQLFDLAQVAGRPFRALSGGEAQRLMLARAVAAAPDLLLVDEPTAQLDLVTSATVNATMRSLAAAGAIVVVATHDPDTRAACTQVIDLGTHVAVAA